MVEYTTNFALVGTEPALPDEYGEFKCPSFVTLRRRQLPPFIMEIVGLN
jgi:hypothetical protein